MTPSSKPCSKLLQNPRHMTANAWRTKSSLTYTQNVLRWKHDSELNDNQMCKVTQAWRKQKSHWSYGVHRGQGAVARGTSMNQESSALQMLRGIISKWGSEVMGSNNQLQPHTGSGEAKIQWSVLTSTENTEKETRSQEWRQQERGEEKRAESPREPAPLQTWQAVAWAEETKTPRQGL